MRVVTTEWRAEDYRLCLDIARMFVEKTNLTGTWQWTRHIVNVYKIQQEKPK